MVSSLELKSANDVGEQHQTGLNEARKKYQSASSKVADEAAKLKSMKSSAELLRLRSKMQGVEVHYSSPPAKLERTLDYWYKNFKHTGKHTASDKGVESAQHLDLGEAGAISAPLSAYEAELTREREALDDLSP